MVNSATIADSDITACSTTYFYQHLSHENFRLCGSIYTYVQGQTYILK